MITRRAPGMLQLVVNAGGKAEDLDHLRAHLTSGVEIEYLAGQALLALQGPAAARVLATHVPGIDRIPFMSGTSASLSGAAAYIMRSGYTGEDGYEISISAEDAEYVARTLLGHPEVKPIGLGARDSLRLESGMCLYGHDIDKSTTPVEGNLAWSIPRRRREQGGFKGASTILAQLGRRAFPPACRNPTRRPRPGARGDRDLRQGRHAHWRRDQRRLFADPRPPDRHGLRADAHGLCRHAVDAEGARPRPVGQGRETTFRSYKLLPSRRRHRMTRHFTKDHEWIEVNGDTATVGITQYAQHQLGDVVYVELPDVGATLVQHAEAAVVESVKAASDVFSPADGTVSEVNTGLAENPAGINGDPEGNAWMFRMTLSKPDQIEALMDAGAYEAFCTGLG